MTYCKLRTLLYEYNLYKQEMMQTNSILTEIKALDATTLQLYKIDQGVINQN